MKLYGIIIFSSSILCSVNSLGQTVNITIAGNDGTLTLPSLPLWEEDEDDPLRKNLIAPLDAKNWKRGEKPIFWGTPISYPEGNSKVEKVLLRFEVENCNEEPIYQDIYNGFSVWVNLFNQYIALLTTQYSWSSVVTSRCPESLELIEDKEDGLSHISNQSPEHITISIPSMDVSLQQNHLIEACRLASLDLAPRLEYAMLLEAYKARGESDYRKAIIEAAAALEICLTERIMQEFDNQQITFGDKLFKKFRMLGGKFELIRVLGIELPDKDYNTLMLNPRNEVMHKAAFPDAQITNILITEVENLLKNFTPVIHQNV